MALAADPDLKAKGVGIVGVAQKDAAGEHPALPRAPRATLTPRSGSTRDGRAGIDWGVYGVPETFIVRGDGVIAYKFVGPMSPETHPARPCCRRSKKARGPKILAPCGQPAKKARRVGGLLSLAREAADQAAAVAGRPPP